MGSGYLPVDTPPGTAPLPLGQPAPANIRTPSISAPRVPRIKKGPTPSGKGRIKKPSMGKKGR